MDYFNQNQKNRALQIFNSIKVLYPSAKTELSGWKTPFQFLICIILSAQTTDKQVNKVVPRLFEKFPTADAFATADVNLVADLIKGLNYYKSKAKYIIKTASIIVNSFDGRVPKNIDALVKLPGVGYKTANVFLNDLYEANQGIAVDTHVRRVAQRLGFSKNEDPTKIAKDLEVLFPRDMWHEVNSTLVLFGRYICTARKPKCEKCPVKKWCPFSQDVK